MDELLLQDETLLETMHSYMDASLISLIEDFGSLGESRLSLEDQNEVSLLTALTEILDNADSENLSPFDSIPDSELLVSPRESSSLHKLITLSRTPPERDLITPVDPLGPSTGSSKVDMSLTDPSWDFSPPPFLETSSPKLPSWRPPRSRPRWGQSSPPLQRSDGEEEEELASFSGQVLTGELTNSMSNISDFPMHLACPEEEDTMAAEMLVQPAGDESISSLSELVRAMHPYCLPNLTQLTALESELQEQPDDLTLPEDCVVLEIVGQAATAGSDLEIPVVVRQIPPGPQPALLEDALDTGPALQLLMPEIETETEAAVLKETLCPEKEVLSLDSEGKLEPACMLEPTEVMEPVAPQGPHNPLDNTVLSSQRAQKNRRKKNKEQSAACAEGCGRRLRSSSRGQSKVASEVISQAGSLSREELWREVGPPRGRGKPRAWARAWAAALEKPSSVDLESSSEQTSSPKEGPLDFSPKMVDIIQANSVSVHLSPGDSAAADTVPLDSEADPTALDSVFADPSPAGPALVDLASANTKLVDPLPAESLLIDPVLAESVAEDPAVVVPMSDDLPPVTNPVPAVPAVADSVPDHPAPVEPVLVKSRPTDPRRAALSSAQGSPASQLLLESESSNPSKATGPLKVESGTSATTQEAKPRPLSLSEYRRRRQQRQADAGEKSSQPPAGKWPSLPETPTGLADIPCLVIPPAPAKKTTRQRSSEVAPEAASVPVAPSPASPSPELPVGKLVVSALTEQLPSQEIPQSVRPLLPTVQSMPSLMSTALPFSPGGLGMTPMLPLPTNGHGVPSLPPPPLQPPSVPMTMGPVPPDPYTHYAPLPPWPCYPPVSPSGYPCLPPPPTVPLVSGTPGTYAVPPTCNVPWVPPPTPVPPYSSNCAYGPVGWGQGLQHPPFWPTVPPPPLPLASGGRAVPPPAVEPCGSSADLSVSESVLPVPVAPPLAPGPAAQGVAQIDTTEVEVKPVPASPHRKHKASSPVQSPLVKTTPCLSAESVTVEEPELETVKPEAQETRPKEKPPSPVVKVVSKSTARQSSVPRLPAVHPARLRKLTFLPNPQTQGPDDVVQAFISEIGIEASDLSSLLEQFEKSEAKKECPPPAPADNLAVGNSGRVDTPQEKRPLDRLQAPELANVAGLTPPATPPHQLWKPLAAVSLLAKAKSPKSTAQEGTLKPEGVTEAQHPAAARLQEGVRGPSPVHVGSGDHDYCVRSRTPPKKMPALVIPEVGSRWNVKRHQDITIKPVLSLGPGTPVPPRTAVSQEPLDHRTSNEQADPSAPCLAPSALLSPEASPCRNDTRTPPEPSATQPSVRCYRKACRSTSPPNQGWQGRRGRSRSVSSGSNRTSEASSSSSSSSSSRSRSRSLSPPHKRWRRSSCSSSGHSRRCSSSSSSSSSSSTSSSSSSSRSRSRSPSPRRRSDRRRRYNSYHRSHDHYQRQRVLQKERAIEERRVVFIGKIPGRMTRSELKQRFSVFGEIEECTIHFRVQGDNYGFVTYRYAEEAFAAIESGHKLRQGDEQPFDLCFGGRRQFCKRSYSDLDSNREDFDPAPVKSKFDSLDFDTLLKKAQKNLRR